ncbi:MAG: 4'-phosphopantetheinyl transferase family protein [Blastocatellia bacterium]
MDNDRQDPPSTAHGADKVDFSCVHAYPLFPMELPDNEAHVWRVALQTSGETLSRFSGLLDAGEQTRAARFHFARDRHRFIAAHGALRIILAAYTGQRPADLGFGAGAYGKPFLQHAGGAGPEVPALQFNMSHAGDLALIAVTRRDVLGVDVERIDPSVPAMELAGSFFSAREIAELEMVPAGQRARAFFLGWTRKEAWLKACATGLATPLDSFTVSLAPSRPARLLHVRDTPGETAAWRLWSMEPETGYVGAMAMKNTGARARGFAFAHDTP